MSTKPISPQSPVIGQQPTMLPESKAVAVIEVSHDYLPAQTLENRINTLYRWHTPDTVLWDFIKPDLEKLGQLTSYEYDQAQNSLHQSWNQSADPRAKAAKQTLEHNAEQRQILALYRQLLVPA